MDAAVAGLIGAAGGAGIGVAGSLITVWIQNHYQAKRERARSILDFATQNRAQEINLAISQNKDIDLPPVAAFVYHHQALLKLLEDGKGSSEEIFELFRDSKYVSENLAFMASEWYVDSGPETSGK